MRPDDAIECKYEGCHCLSLPIKAKGGNGRTTLQVLEKVMYMRQYKIPEGKWRAKRKECCLWGWGCGSVAEHLLSVWNPSVVSSTRGRKSKDRDGRQPFAKELKKEHVCRSELHQPVTSQ